jgi:hypothetical protein
MANLTPQGQRLLVAVDSPLNDGKTTTVDGVNFIQHDPLDPVEYFDGLPEAPFVFVITYQGVKYKWIPMYLLAGGGGARIQFSDTDLHSIGGFALNVKHTERYGNLDQVQAEKTVAEQVANTKAAVFVSSDRNAPSNPNFISTDRNQGSHAGTIGNVVPAYQQQRN